MRDQYMRTAQGVLLVCSYTDKSSLDEVPFFLEQLMRTKDIDPKHLSVVIAINKADLPVEERCITYEQVCQVADLYSVAHVIETSAKTGQGVVDAYKKLAIVTTDLFGKEPSFIKQLEEGKELFAKSAYPNYDEIHPSKGCCIVN